MHDSIYIIYSDTKNVFEVSQGSQCSAIQVVPLCAHFSKRQLCAYVGGA